jgi:hypothetical protein
VIANALPSSDPSIIADFEHDKLAALVEAVVQLGALVVDDQSITAARWTARFAEASRHRAVVECQLVHAARTPCTKRTLQRPRRQ